MNNKEKLLEIFEAVFETPVTEDASVLTLKDWNSLKHIELMMVIEEEFGCTISPDEIPNLTSFKDILKKIEG